MPAEGGGGGCGGTVSLDANYWIPLLEDYRQGYAQAFPPNPPPTRESLILAASVAEHETNNGRAWVGSNNFGSVQLRPLTLQERSSFDAGTLKAGDYTPTRDGVLHVDTHPGPSGPIPYPVWFAAFASRVAGIAHFLKTLWRDSANEPDRLGATPATLAQAMYVCGYYEGAHHGARPVGQRKEPLTVPEIANVADYAAAVARCQATIAPMVAGWDYGAPNAEDSGSVCDPNTPTDPAPPTPRNA